MTFRPIYRNMIQEKRQRFSEISRSPCCFYLYVDGPDRIQEYRSPKLRQITMLDMPHNKYELTISYSRRIWFRAATTFSCCALNFFCADCSFFLPLCPANLQ